MYVFCIPYSIFTTGEFYFSELQNFSNYLSSSIIQRAVEEAADLLSKERQKSMRRAYERPAAAARPKRRGSCQVSTGGLLPLDRLSVGHSPHSEGESGMMRLH